jgi:hypothetical protein
MVFAKSTVNSKLAEASYVIVRTSPEFWHAGFPRNLFPLDQEVRCWIERKVRTASDWTENRFGRLQAHLTNAKVLFVLLKKWSRWQKGSARISYDRTFVGWKPPRQHKGKSDDRWGSCFNTAFQLPAWTSRPLSWRNVDRNRGLWDSQNRNWNGTTLIEPKFRGIIPIWINIACCI